MHIRLYKKLTFSLLLAFVFTVLSGFISVNNSHAVCSVLMTGCFPAQPNVCQNNGTTYCCTTPGECQTSSGGGGNPAGTINNINGVATIAGIDDLFQNVLAVVLEIAAVILFIMLVVGGFRYLTSGGNPKTAEAAKHTITYAILGMILVASAFLIIQLIEDFTGAPISEFSVVGN